MNYAVKKNETLWFYVILFCIVLCAFAFRIWFIPAHAIWMDEAITITECVPENSVQKVIERSVQHNGFPPADYLLHNCIYKLFGLNEWSVKFLPVLTGCIGVFLLGLIGRHLADWRVGLIASLWLALSPLHLYFSLEVRPYTHLCMAAILFAYMLLRCISHFSIINTILLGSATVYAFSVSIFAVFFVPIISGCILITHGYTKEKIQASIQVMVVVLIGIIIAFCLYKYTGLIDKILEATIKSHSPVHPLKTWQTILQSFFSIHAFLCKKPHLFFVTSILSVFMIFWRFRQHYTLKILSLAFFFSIPCIAYIFEITGGEYALKPRYIIYSLPFILLGLSYSIIGIADIIIISVGKIFSLFSAPFKIKKQQILAFCIGLIFMIVMAGYYGINGYQRIYFTEYDKSPYRSIRKYVDSLTEHNDVLVVSKVLYDYSPHLYFDIFRPSSAIKHKYTVYAIKNIPFSWFQPYLLDIVSGQMNVVIITKRNTLKLKKNLFECWQPKIGYPSLDVWTMKDIPDVISDEEMHMYCTLFGQQFRKARKSFYHNPNKPESVSIAEVCHVLCSFSNKFRFVTELHSNNIYGLPPINLVMAPGSNYTSQVGIKLDRNYDRFRGLVHNVDSKKFDCKILIDSSVVYDNNIITDKTSFVDISVGNATQMIFYCKNKGVDGMQWEIAEPYLIQPPYVIQLVSMRDIYCKDNAKRLMRGCDVKGNPVMLSGRLSSNVLSIFPPDKENTSLFIPLNKSYTWFYTKMKVLGGKVIFKIKGDVQHLYSSDVVTDNSDYKEVRLPVSMFNELELVINGYGYADTDNAVWVDPVLEKPPSILIRTNFNDSALSNILLTHLTNKVYVFNNMYYRNVIAARTFPRSTGSIIIPLHTGFERFKCRIHAVNSSSTNEVKIYVDSRQVYNGMMNRSGQYPVYIDIALTNASFLKLEFISHNNNHLSQFVLLDPYIVLSDRNYNGFETRTKGVLTSTVKQKVQPEEEYICLNTRDAKRHEYVTVRSKNDIMVNGFIYNNGMCIQPLSDTKNGRIVYDVPVNARRFVSLVKLEHPHSDCIVTVRDNNNKTLFSKKVKGKTEPVAINVNVSNIEQIHLYINAYGYSSNDMVLLIEPVFIK